MLQTPAIKPDSSVPAASIKEKDPPAQPLDTNFSSYFNQMMAALPAPLMDTPAPPANAPAQRPAVSAKKGGQNPNPALAAAPAANTDAQGALAAASAQQTASPPAPSPSPQASDRGTSSQNDPGQSSTVNGSGPGALAGTAGGAAALAAAKGSAQGSGPQPQAQPFPAASTPTSPADPTAAAPPAPPANPADAQAIASARTALDQAYPGGKFQMQFAPDAVPATTKAPLTEFMNQLQMEPKGLDPSVQSASLPTDALIPAAPAASPGLAATAALPATLVAGSTAATGLAMAKEAAPAPGSALTGNLAPALAVGAAAAPGAFGAVRVTAAQTADPPAPTRRQNPMAQVDGTIRWLVKNQDQGAELQLHPESLGRVQIKLKVEGNVVHAKLWASEASAIPVMQQHRAFLEDSLKSQGLVLGSFDLQHGRRDDQTPTPSSQESASAISGAAARPKAGQESPVLAAAAAPRGNRIEYVA